MQLIYHTAKLHYFSSTIGRESADEQLESTTCHNSTEVTSDENPPPEDRSQPSDEEPEDLQGCVVLTGVWGWSSQGWGYI